MRQIDILKAGDGPTRKVAVDAVCPLCPDPIEPTDVVVRIWDVTNAPVRETVMHKTCMRLLMDCTIDDDEVAGFLPMRAMIEAHPN